MAELGISLSSKLIEVVGSDVIRDIGSIWGYKSQLDDLKDTISTVRNVLRDAESKDSQLGQEAEDYIRKLKNAVYDADDLFDEFVTLVELKQHDKGSKLSDKVRDFFSPRRNSLSVAYSMSREVKKIRKKLDSVASNHHTFGFSVDSQPIRNRREETCSYVYKDEVVGREGDVEKVVHMLLDSSSQERVSFVSIVGIGGLGKTTLAQLVFNDDRVKSEFPLRLWTCVSDENTKDFDLKKIITNILGSVSHDIPDGFGMDSIQGKLGGLLGGKKFLIVLDDLWNEDRNKWLGLKKFLMVGGTESWVLVTTRSKRTALVVSDNSDKYRYELKCLSPDDSWRLFEMTAFGSESNSTDDVCFSELVKLGKQIVEKCSHVPLAIRVVGTLLYGQNESKWRFFQEYGLAKLNNGENEVMSILKLSYDYLESPLKACFTYCSLFPKDFRINKEKLIRLWLAQGYIVPFHVGQSLDEAAEEYFSILLRRCFFQEVQMNIYGRVESLKIHDLIHDLAQKLAGKDVVALDSITSNLGDDVHHILHLGSKCKGSFFPKCKIRSYVRHGFEINFPVVNLVRNWNFLRTLDLHKLDIQALPNSIGKLLHLRYLDVSDNNRLRSLPDSITNLYNLQTLDLNRCCGLEELPKYLVKLVNLKYLDINLCHNLSHMPSGLDKLSGLCVLTDFVVGEGGLGSLESLQALTNLRGSLQIRTTRDFRITIDCDQLKERYLRRMKHLEMLGIHLFNEENHESFLERLEPPSSVKALYLRHYNDSKLPTNWYGVEGNLTTLLPNLVRVVLVYCSKLVHLPSLSKLLHLKSLSLFSLTELEFIEDTTHETDASIFFPSLEYLGLSYMDNLKGWWKRQDVNSNTWQPCFSKLSMLKIGPCSKVTSFPNCPRLEQLLSNDVNKDLLMSLGKEEGLIKLKEVETNDLDYLKSFPIDSLTSLTISRNEELKSFSELGETFFGNFFSLRSLRIHLCCRLRSLYGGGWEHLTSLESLQLYRLPKLVFSGRGWNTDNNDDGDNDNDNSDGDGILWRSLQGSLRSLTLIELEIKTLPKGLRYLTSLQNLDLHGCKNLEWLPEWISCLSSLQTLGISRCERLKSLPGNVRDLTSLQFLQVKKCPLLAERLQDQDGEDWLNVRHIPTVDISTD